MTSKETVARLALWSIVIALGVMALKFAAWRLTGSVALLSDALESIVNVLAAAVAFVAIRVSHLPADAGHPFGHHKAEYFSAVLEGALIIVAALLIAQSAFGALREPQPVQRLDIGLAVNGFAAALNALWAAVLIRAGAKARSPALVADGRHILTDVATSAGVIAGLLAARATGLAVLDPLLALLVGVNILWQGWRLVNASVQGLMDAGVEPQENFRIRDIISAHAGGALEVHDLRTRVAGRATFIEFHLVVDRDMSVGAAHEICDRIEDALRAEIPGVRVVIHVEPDAEAKLPRGATAVPFA
ncbi:MAG TPA: cation diffusion facilitator family transporter [Mesorhizobium sp.]|jgi:cation diffusion facilitator family transporter|nr:cation diffusion facilitator family transporter [Mesorhizobium sp.]